MSLKKKAQAGLEYLMTYGWALILVTAVVGVLVFLVSTPVAEVKFTSSDPLRFLLKGGSVNAGVAEIKMQNISGGKMTITSISGDYVGCIVNGENVPTVINTGEGIDLQCTVPAEGTGEINIVYTDFAGLQRTVSVTGNAIVEVDSGGESSAGYSTPGGTATCSTFHSSFICPNAHDNSFSTYWISVDQSDPQDIYFDLGSNKFVSGVRIKVHSSYTDQTMNIDVSDNAANWTNVATGWTPTDGVNWNEKTFTETNARYVRVFISNSPGYTLITDTQIKSRG